METQNLVRKERLTEALKGQFPRGKFDYEDVFVSLIIWEESDDKGFAKEAQELKELFEGFNYTAEIFKIPSADSHTSLLQHVIDVGKKTKGRDTLTIIHYGGHADPDDDRGRNRRAVWAAKRDRSNSIKLEWFNIQPHLKQFHGNVWLILDCCFAAQAARVSERVVPPNVELLAACSMSRTTPLAAHHSFTSGLIKELRERLENEDSFTTVASIYDALVSLEAGLEDTPFHQALGPPSRTVRLRHLPLSRTEIKVPGARAWVQLSVHLSNHIDDSLLQELIAYLKDDAPEAVCGVNCDSIVEFAEAAIDYIQSSTKRGVTSIGFDQLERSPRSRVNFAWSECTSWIYDLVSFLKASPRRDSTDNTTSVQASRREAFIIKQLVEAMKSLEQALALAVNSASIASKEEALRIAMDHPSLKRLGVVEFLKIRLAQMEPPDPLDRFEISPIITADAKSSVWSPNIVLEMIHQKAVVVEYKEYIESNQRDRHAQEVRTDRVKALVAVLQAATSAHFLSLKCLNWSHDRSKSRYGMNFEIPHGQAGRPYSLREVLSEQQTYGRAGLKERFTIAAKVGRALLNWNIADWLHQGIASHHVVFFCDSKTSRIDFASPYLCGFEFSRKADEISTNRTGIDFSLDIYRHPTRQGYPKAGHRIQHDLYSFGVLLMDIGLWQKAEAYVKKEGTKTLPGPAEVKQKIVQNISRLDYYMGPEYRKAVKRCIFEEWTPGKSHLEIADEFKIEVLDKIVCSGTNL